MINKKRLIGTSLLTACGLVCLVFIKLNMNMPSQELAERFSSDGSRFAQVSAFYTSGNEVDTFTINRYRSEFQKSLEEASIKKTYNEGRIWMDAYSSQMEATAVKQNTTQKIQLIGTGADFFQFHPLEFQTGYYYQTENVMKDQVIISEEAAWQLYGSYDVIGLNLEINGVTCYVAGVFKQPQGKMEKKAVGDNPLVFAPIELLQAVSGSEPGISCYEILLPDAVTGFAKNMVYKNVADVDFSSTASENVNLDALNQEIVQNTDRFSFIRILSVIKNYQLRAMHTKAIEYPYWENIARVKESEIAYAWVLAGLFFILPLIQLVGYLIVRFKNRKWTAKRIKGIIDNKIEERKRKKWEAKKND